MTPKQKAARAYEMLMAGLDYGAKTARVAIEVFPNGVHRDDGNEILKITDNALTTALDIYALGGIARRYRDNFEAGFRLALRNTFADSANSLKDSTIVG